MRDGKPREGWRMHPYVGQNLDLEIIGSIEHGQYGCDNKILSRDLNINFGSGTSKIVF